MLTSIAPELVFGNARLRLRVHSSRFAGSRCALCSQQGFGRASSLAALQVGKSTAISIAELGNLPKWTQEGHTQVGAATRQDDDYKCSAP